MLPVFMKLAESRFEKAAKGWTYTPIGSQKAGYVADAAAYAQIRHAHATLIFLTGVELLAAVGLLFFATVVTMQGGNPLAGMGVPFQIIALVPVAGIPLLYGMYRFRIKKWLLPLPGSGSTVK